MTGPRTTGVLLGKFLPPHLGHVYLAEFARRYADELTVVVATLAREPIPGELRYAWMKELFPGARVVHVTDDLPQEPAEHPEFWRIWRDVLRRAAPGRLDFVFASEEYGRRLAQELDARFVPVDPARTAVPVSGTRIREDPMAHWAYLPRCVRPYFARRICLMGSECSGKTTLARDLAARFGTVWVPEYARTLLEAQGGVVAATDLEAIARGQIASEEALARDAHRLLICDTDALTTVLWCETLFGSCPEWIRREADRRTYALTFLTDPDIPWQGDAVRYLPPDTRRAFFDRCRRELEARGRRYAVVAGAREQRLEAAVKALV